jgi:hypothetical protein
MQQVFEVPAEAAKLDDGCCPARQPPLLLKGRKENRTIKSGPRVFICLMCEREPAPVGF